MPQSVTSVRDRLCWVNNWNLFWYLTITKDCYSQKLDDNDRQSLITSVSVLLKVLLKLLLSCSSIRIDSDCYLITTLNYRVVQKNHTFSTHHNDVVFKDKLKVETDCTTMFSEFSRINKNYFAVFMELTNILCKLGQFYNPHKRLFPGVSVDVIFHYNSVKYKFFSF